MIDSGDSNDVVIVGAGPAGLTAALELQRHTGRRPVVLEADTQVGGISKTIEYRGNRMDLGGHRFFSKSDWVVDWWQQVLPIAAECVPAPASSDGGGAHWPFNSPTRIAPPGTQDAMLVRQRLSRILYRRKFYDYPISLSARTLLNLGAFQSAAIGASYARARILRRSPETTLEDFLINRFGERLYLTFFKSYTEKVWGVPCDEISAEWGAQRIKGLSISRALAHAARRLLPRAAAAKGTVETSLIERFLYPRLGPGQMWEVVARRVEQAGGAVHLGHKVTGIHRSGRRVVGVDVLDLASNTLRRVACGHLVSSMPIGELVRQLEPEADEVGAIARALPHRDFMTAGVLLRRLRGTGSGARADAPMPADNWIYVQEEDVKLGRIQVFNNWSPHLVRDPATIWLGLEYFCDAGDRLWSMGDGEFLDFAAAELQQIGLADRRDVLDGTVVRVPKAYPAYFGQYLHMQRVRDWLDDFDNVFAIGRNGMHRYNNQDHSMLAAREAVECIATGKRDRAALWAINTEEDYHEERAGTASGPREEGAGTRWHIGRDGQDRR